MNYFKPGRRSALITVGAFLISQVLMSLLPFFTYVDAANNLQAAKITLSDSRPSKSSVSHTIYFQATTALSASEKIIIDYPSDFDVTGMGAANVSSMKISANADMSSASTCTVADDTNGVDTVALVEDGTTDTLTFQLATSGTCSTVTADYYVEIVVTGFANPSKSASAGTADTYLITMSTTNSGETTTYDTATVRVAIIDAVTISATIQATLSFVVAGVSSSTSVGNSYDATDVTTTATTIPFGTINASTTYTAAQLLKVSTNATNGFYVAVKQDANLTDAASNDIDQFTDGTAVDNSTPSTWASPSGTPGSENTYGHLGYGTTDTTLTDLNGSGTSSRFATAKFAGLTTTYEAVLSHGSPADGTGSDTNGQGYAVYQLEVSGLQQAGIYSSTITYLATAQY
ncbi:MAG: hypothetical protein GXP43_00515 [bacterium]|nr:hypothetical protein [bacterium]